jgi:hypothetical protein
MLADPANANAKRITAIAAQLIDEDNPARMAGSEADAKHAAA